MFMATATRGATWLAVGAFAFTAVSAAGQDGGDAGWYPAVRAEIVRLQTDLLSLMAEADLPEGARAQARSQIEGNIEGFLRNLDAEIAGVGPRLSAARLEHGPQEGPFLLGRERPRPLGRAGDGGPRRRGRRADGGRAVS